MFGTKHNECVGFESRWRVKKVSTETSTQTTEFSASEKGTNTLDKTSIEVQTVTDDTIEKNPEVDMQKLADWLSNIYPKVKKEIDEANNSHAFKGYRLADELCEANCKLTQTVNISKVIEEGNKVLRVSGISWNQTGKTIAITCGYEHKSWCYHTGSVVTYTLDGDDKLPETPRKILHTETCVMSLKFHPQHPAVLAAGTFSGAVIVWNVQGDDEDIVATVGAHEEAVTQLSWVNDTDLAKTVLLASSSTDGCLKLWNFNLANSSLNIKAKYKIKPPLFASISRSNKTSGTVSKKDWRAIICFDFSRHVSDLFVVGAEGGLVAQCSVLGANELKGSTKDEPLFDPVYKFYEPHEGEITHVSITPNRKDMFLTYGTDSEIRVYLFGQEEPAQIIFTKNPLICLDFVLHEERLVAGCGRNGILELFELRKGRPLGNVTTEKVRKQVLTGLAMNSSKTNVVAVGTASGDLQLWNVPWRAFVRNI